MVWYRMSTLMELAKGGEISREMEAVSKAENIPVEKIMKGLANGTMVIPRNAIKRDMKVIGIGEGLRVKVNANIGTSSDCIDIKEELEKVEICLKYNADAVMDLSTGGDLTKIRREILKYPIMLGTVPIYEVGSLALKKHGAIVDMDEDSIFKVIEAQAKQGVDFMTLHAGLTLEGLERMKKRKRLAGMVSRGGSFMAAWMLQHGKENPLYTNYDQLLEISREHDVTLSLGDALRPGSLHDATDRAQVHELIILGELVDRARDAGVQCMVEGPGHMSMEQIEANIILQKRLCRNAPFYVLGPLVTDIAPGYDHITGAIGGAIAARAGADFLCYVTPAEHLALPEVEDVKLGIIASKIAAHAADVSRGIDLERDYDMSKARANLDWDRQFQLCMDPEKARSYREKRQPKSSEVCTMCGEFCAVRLIKDQMQLK